MHNLFQSGAAYVMVAVLSLIAAAIQLVDPKGSTGSVVVYMGNALVWLSIAIAVRRKNKARHKPDTKS